MDIETLMKDAFAEAVREQPHRNDKYKPVIHTLAADKNMTTVQIYEWFKSRNITVGTGYIARVRRLHLKSIGEDEDSETESAGEGEGQAEAAPATPTPATPTQAESLQPVARTRTIS